MIKISKKKVERSLEVNGNKQMEVNRKGQNWKIIKDFKIEAQNPYSKDTYGILVELSLLDKFKILFSKSLVVYFVGKNENRT